MPKCVEAQLNYENTGDAWGGGASLDGPVGLQSEGAEIHFRKIHLEPK